MASPILLTWKARPVRQIFELPEAEQQKLWARRAEAVQASGMQSVLFCRCDWSLERSTHFGVELYQDMDSLMKCKDILSSVNWSTWIDSETVLSVPEAPVTPVAPGSGGIYKLVYVRPTQAYYNLSTQERAEKFEPVRAMQERLGVQTLFTALSFSSERNLGVSVERHTSIEALQEHARCLWEMDWFQYVDADIVIGLQIEP